MGNLMIGSIYPPSLFNGTLSISKVMCGSEQVWPNYRFIQIVVNYKSQSLTETHVLNISSDFSRANAWPGTLLMQENDSWYVYYSFDNNDYRLFKHYIEIEGINVEKVGDAIRIEVTKDYINKISEYGYNEDEITIYVGDGFETTTYFNYDITFLKGSHHRKQGVLRADGTGDFTTEMTTIDGRTYIDVIVDTDYIVKEDTVEITYEYPENTVRLFKSDEKQLRIRIPTDTHNIFGPEDNMGYLVVNGQYGAIDYIHLQIEIEQPFQPTNIVIDGLLYADHTFVPTDPTSQWSQYVTFDGAPYYTCTLKSAQIPQNFHVSYGAIYANPTGCLEVDSTSIKRDNYFRALPGYFGKSSALHKVHVEYDTAHVLMRYLYKTIYSIYEEWLYEFNLYKDGTIVSTGARPLPSGMITTEIKDGKIYIYDNYSSSSYRIISREGHYITDKTPSYEILPPSDTGINLTTIDINGIVYDDKCTLTVSSEMR